MSLSKLPAALAQRAGSQSLSHAYLLTGGDEDALLAGATALAAAYLCAGEGERPCGACKSCKKVDKGIHPDVIQIQPEPGKGLVVDQIRALRADAYIRPNEAQRKVYILQGAQRMNPSAQNAFLKVLEEGPAYAAFLLLAPNPMALLPTIRSRCETVRLDRTEAVMDPELERRGGELAGLLLGADRWRRVSWCVPWEKAKREEILPLWEATRQALLTYRRTDTTPKAVRLAGVLAELTAAGSQNGNMGILWGRLLAAADA